MFSHVTKKYSDELEKLKGVIAWQDKLRSTLYLPANVAAPIAIENQTLQILQVQAPNKVVWQLFDHYAAVSRIYALFELAVGEIVAEYVKVIPLITPAYASLVEDTRIQYRLGVAQILSKWGPSKSLYSHLAESAIPPGLADGLRNMSYSLLADAFLTDSDNYRTDTLVRIFKRLGFHDIFAAIRKAPAITNFCNGLGTDSPDSYLNEFVRARNDAAHGNVSSVSSAAEILQYAEFIDLVIKELTSILLSRALKDGVQSGWSRCLGQVLHVFSNNVVGVSSSANVSIKTGDTLYAGTKLLEPVNVISIRIHTTEYSMLDITEGLEFGLGLDRKLPNGSELYLLS